MAVQNVIGDSFRGATWVAIHNGGGVGWYVPFSHIHEDCYQVFPSLNTHANGEEFLYRAAGLNEHRYVTEVPLSQVIHLGILLLCMLVEVTFSRQLSPMLKNSKKLKEHTWTTGRKEKKRATKTC